MLMRQSAWKNAGGSLRVCWTHELHSGCVCAVHDDIERALGQRYEVLEMVPGQFLPVLGDDVAKHQVLRHLIGTGI